MLLRVLYILLCLHYPLSNICESFAVTRCSFLMKVAVKHLILSSGSLLISERLTEVSRENLAQHSGVLQRPAAWLVDLTHPMKSIQLL